MSRVALILAFAIGAVAAQTPGPSRLASGQVVVLAELFTSEGCESCPPADRLLETLLKQQPAAGVYVVPLSEHVTYWDHQGWKDPFAAEQYTTRQKEYGLRFNLDSIYTPQLVIDGTRELIGSDEAELKRVLAKPGIVKPHLQVDLASTATAIDVAISGPGLNARNSVVTWKPTPTSRSADPGELMVALTEDDLVVDVKRGENAGRMMRHSGVVRSLQSLGNAQSATPPKGAVDSMVLPARTVRIDLKPEWQRSKLRVVAFVQSKNTRQVLSVGWQSLQ